MSDRVTQLQDAVNMVRIILKLRGNFAVRTLIVWMTRIKWVDFHCHMFIQVTHWGIIVNSECISRIIQDNKTYFQVADLQFSNHRIKMNSMYSLSNIYCKILFLIDPLRLLGEVSS